MTEFEHHQRARGREDGEFDNPPPKKALIHAGMGSDLMALCGKVEGCAGHDQVRLSYVVEQVTCPDCLKSRCASLQRDYDVLYKNYRQRDDEEQQQAGQIARLREALETYMNRHPEDELSHVWRACAPGEPMEEGGVCVNCGCWATTEGNRPCPRSDPEMVNGQGVCGDAAMTTDNAALAETQYDQDDTKCPRCKSPSKILSSVNECIHPWHL